MLPFVTEFFRVLESVTEYDRVFLAHLLGPISGLVSVGFFLFFYNAFYCRLCPLVTVTKKL